MRVTKLKLHNILGFEDYELTFGDVTEISGANATGKTSVQQAIVGLLGKGHDASLLRAGCERGETVLLLEDPEDGTTVTVTAEVTREDTDRKAISSKVGKIGAVAKYLAGLSDLFALNPIEFIREKDPQKRIAWVAQFAAVDVDDSEIERAAGSKIRPPERRRTALQTIAAIRQRVYDERTGVNRLAEDKRRTARELEATLPEPVTVATAPEVAQTLLEPLRELRISVERKIQQVQEVVNSALEAEKKRLQEAYTAAIELARATRDDGITAALDLAQAAVAERTARLQAELRELVVGIAVAEEHNKSVAGATAVRKLVERAQTEAGVKEQEARALTAALERLDELKLSLLAKLPVKGMTIGPDDIELDDIPFDRVNTARKVGVGLQLSVARAAQLGCKLIVLDDAEHLDAKNFAALEEGCKKLVAKGYQFLIGRVTEGPLETRTL